MEFLQSGSRHDYERCERPRRGSCVGGGKIHDYSERRLDKRLDRSNSAVKIVVSGGSLKVEAAMDALSPAKIGGAIPKRHRLK
jgi:hypothetical protein